MLPPIRHNPALKRLQRPTEDSKCGGLHEVAGVERSEFVCLARRKPQTDEALGPSFLHRALEGLDAVPAVGDGFWDE